MLSNFFRRSTDKKQRVNREQNLEIGSAASSGRQKKILASLGLRLRQHFQFFHSNVFDKKVDFFKGSNTKWDYHQCRIKIFLKKCMFR
jgi:hypothetical protein